MPAVDIKNELRGEQNIKPQIQNTPISPIQISASEDLQRMLVDIVLDDYQKGREDREKLDYGRTSKGETLHFTDWVKRIKDLYNGVKIPKTIPWQFCSNRSLRIATSVLDLLHSRLFPAVWNEDLTRWRAGEKTDAPKVERITKFMDWWIRVWSPLRPFFDSWTKLTAGFGDSLTETYWDVEEIVTGESIENPILDSETNEPLINQDGTPAVQKFPKINRIEKSKSKIIPKENVYLFKGSKDIQRDPVPIVETYTYKQLEDLEKSGACINVSDKLKSFIIVPEPSGSNLSPEEKERLKSVKLRNQSVDVIRWYGHYDVDGIGVSESIRIMISKDHRVYLGGVRMRDVTKSGRRPLDFTKYDSYLDRPDDMDGEGVLHKVRELAEEIDAIFNQMTDAHTLAVLRPFFFDPSGDVDAPAMTLGPNKGIPVTDPQKNVYFPNIEIPTERLLNAIRLVLEFIERLTAASEYVMGRESGVVGGSGTATRTNAIMQSANTRFNLPSERLRLGASTILSQHLDLIQLNIEPGFENRVLGEDGEPIFNQGELSDMGISGKFDAFLMPDPSMGSKETERQLWDMIYTILMKNMIVMSDVNRIYAVTSQWLKSRGIEDIEKYLGPAPSPDDIDSPEDENTLMIQGDFARVTPQITENHLLHIQKHTDLLKSPHLQQLAQTAPELAKEIIEYGTQHVQQHMAMMQQMLAMTKQMGSQGENGQNNQQGEQGAKTNSSGDSSMQNNNPNGGLENVQGPLGNALNEQRKGKVGTSS